MWHAIAIPTALDATPPTLLFAHLAPMEHTSTTMFVNLAALDAATASISTLASGVCLDMLLCCPQPWSLDHPPPLCSLISLPRTTSSTSLSPAELVSPLA